MRSQNPAHPCARGCGLCSAAVPLCRVVSCRTGPTTAASCVRATAPRRHLQQYGNTAFAAAPLAVRHMPSRWAPSTSRQPLTCSCSYAFVQVVQRLLRQQPGALLRVLPLQRRERGGHGHRPVVGAAGGGLGWGGGIFSGGTCTGTQGVRNVRTLMVTDLWCVRVGASPCRSTDNAYRYLTVHPHPYAWHVELCHTTAPILAHPVRRRRNAPVVPLPCSPCYYPANAYSNKRWW